MVNWSRLIGRSLHSPIGSASIFGAAGCSGISSSFSCSAIHYFGVLTGFAVTSAADFFTASQGAVSDLRYNLCTGGGAGAERRKERGQAIQRRHRAATVRERFLICDTTSAPAEAWAPRSETRRAAEGTRSENP